jgi:hypothetical protein
MQEVVIRSLKSCVTRQTGQRASLCLGKLAKAIHNFCRMTNVLCLGELAKAMILLLE